jgi:hypothetical protein
MKLSVSKVEGAADVAAPPRHLLLGADDHVDGKMVAPVKIGVDRVQIALRPKPRDLAGDAKDGNAPPDR